MKKILTLLLLASTTIAFGQKRKLELNLQKDSTYYLTSNVKLDIDQLIDNTHQIVKSTIVGKVAHKVIAVQDTAYILEVAYKNINMTMDVPGKTISFNSNGDTTNVLSNLMRNVMNKPFTLIVSKTGRIIGIKNLDNIFMNMFDGLPAIDEAKKVRLKNEMQKSFGENAIKNNFQEAFVIYPKKDIAINDSWTNNVSLTTTGISANATAIYTLNGMDDKTYNITGNATIRPEAGGTFKSTNGYYMRLSGITGTIVTNLKVDKQSGWITESKVVKKAKGNVQLKKDINGVIILTYPMVINAELLGSNK
ncbi:MULTISPECIES: DUF6263 family protein [unclassified Mucilaginibacter]|uniref:DUF6263 family protein n=1 Tax=unclassified Mucilaginibacter TaxID=2617802 RepID=UPI00095B6BE5|nr:MULTISPECIES: DUF6263 family protein [unclassified Mucilaginibacter]OJW15084.1 MAG: hypothetical protein BGO48_13075 [Mucilaginibacter sp. 44-25]PLW91235.1 MAG: hypothetical protein C0154_02315 [Mucilaginibacter sp.]HEK19710.1 hypothetical protein [Bacteroidota bacterium]